VEVKDQQIHTELTETQHQHVLAGRTPEQQGRTYAYNSNALIQPRIVTSVTTFLLNCNS